MNNSKVTCISIRKVQTLLVAILLTACDSSVDFSTISSDDTRSAPGGITYTLHLNGVPQNIASEIATSMREAVDFYNQHGNFNKSLNVYYVSSVPTAQAGYSGSISFGGYRNTRAAIHEIAHTLGVGTTSQYRDRVRNRQWTGSAANRLIASYDGNGTVVRTDGTHFWPYGLNYDNEDSTQNRLRHVKIVQAMQCDMGLGACSGSNPVTPIQTASRTSIAGNNKTITNRASGKVLDAYGSSNGANAQYPVLIWHCTRHGAVTRKFSVCLKQNLAGTSSHLLSPPDNALTPTVPATLPT